ncbi:MAG: hypothetical protein ACKVI4_17920 [Actinomycetales bacterium]
MQQRLGMGAPSAGAPKPRGTDLGAPGCTEAATEAPPGLHASGAAGPSVSAAPAASALAAGKARNFAEHKRLNLRAREQDGLDTLQEVYNRMHVGDPPNLTPVHPYHKKVLGILTAAEQYDVALKTLEKDNKITVYNEALARANELIVLMSRSIDELTRPTAQSQGELSHQVPLAHLATSMVSELSEDFDALVKQQSSLTLEAQRMHGKLSRHVVQLLKHVNTASAQSA